MAEVGAAWITIAPSTKGFKGALTKQVGGQVSSAGKSLGTSFGKAFKVGAVALMAGGIVAGKFLKGAIDEAREAQVVTARTENVIKSMGLASKVTASQVADLAGAISAKTGIDDEAIQAGQNLLLTFKGVASSAGQAGGIFEQTSRLMVDLSAAMGTDAKGAAIQLGKALNDPIKGISALTRVGVSFTEGQKKTIESLVEQGDVMGAQKVILGELTRQFGGAAAAMATPADKAKVAWANFKEELGTRLLPVVDRVLTKFTAFLPKVLPIFGRIADAVMPIISALRDALQPVLVGIGKTFISVLPTVRDMFADIIAAVTPVITAIRDALQPVLEKLVGWIKENPTFVKAFAIALGVLSVAVWAVTAATAAFSVALNSTGIPLLIIGIAALVAGLVVAYQKSETFRSIVDQMAASIKSFATFVRDEVVPTVVSLARKVGEHLKPVWEQLSATFKADVLPTIQKVIAKFREWQPTIQKVIAVVVQIIAKVVEFAAKILGVVLPPLIRLSGFIASHIVPAFLDMTSRTGTAIGKLIEFGKAVVDRVKDFAKFLAGVKEKIGNALDFIKSLPARVVNTLGDLGGVLLNAGKALIQGLIDGIQDKVENGLKGALAAVTNMIPDIKGPPKRDAVLLYPAGQLIMRGLIDGIESGISPLTSKLGEVTDKVAESVKALRDRLKSVLDGLKSDFASLRDGIAGAFNGDLFQATNATDFIAGLTANNGMLASLKKAFGRLRKFGLDPAFISQLFSQGGADLILDLASSKGSAQTAEALFGVNQGLAAGLGTAVASNDIGPHIDRVVNKLDRIEKAIRQQGSEFGRELNHAAARGHRNRR